MRFLSGKFFDKRIMRLRCFSKTIEVAPISAWKRAELVDAVKKSKMEIVQYEQKVEEYEIRFIFNYFRFKKRESQT